MIQNILLSVGETSLYHPTPASMEHKNDLQVDTVFAPLLTFSESKQAITLPFSTWQLLGGCANLHSSLLREQFPR